MSVSTFTTDLRADLAAADLGLVVGTNLFRSQMPPDAEGVLITPYGGRESDNIHRSAFPRVQILCRYATYAAAEAMAYSIYSRLNERENYTMGTTVVTRSDALQPPFSLGQDDRQRARVACNYEFIIRST